MDPVPVNHKIGVALRKESVDRNDLRLTSFWLCGRSLSARRAWIEIVLLFSWCVPPWVALRKESVDRNILGGCVVGSWPRSLSARRAWIEINCNGR